MSLQLYNTLTRQKEPFEPLAPGVVKMYCCGVTVYDDCHLGHARSYSAWDVLRRYLQWRGYQVHYVQNFTDIDDKILNRAREQGSTMEAVADRFIDAYFRDIRQLNILDADEYPRVTDHIPEIQQLIKDLIEKDQAYAVQGDVYYSVYQLPWYGKLSGRKLDEMQAGASGRLDAEDLEGDRKRYPFDFALWKAAKLGEPAWDSPWGPGRPGWHIECSAMIRARLGDTIDIHGGGGDLVFPHHENEIAQSEVATGKPLARYWVHNGMVTVDGKKMSKSLGNFTTIREMLERDRVSAMVIRMFILQAHYRGPLDFTAEAIASATNGWATLQEGLRFGPMFGAKLDWSIEDTIVPLDAACDRFNAAMDDDLNTPVALAVLFELAKDLRRVGNILAHGDEPQEDRQLLQRQWSTLSALAQVLGLEAELEEEVVATGPSEAEIEVLIAQRQAAKVAKNWAEADQIRNELKARGVQLVDRPGGATHWLRESSN